MFKPIIVGLASFILIMLYVFFVIFFPILVAALGA